MASITIFRNLDDHLKARLRVRGALSEERQPATNLSDSIAKRFAPLGGVDLPDLEREPLRDPPRFE